MVDRDLLNEVIAFLHNRHAGVIWPELDDEFDTFKDARTIDWWLPFCSCSALGSPAERAIPVSGAILAAQSSIILVDDILDADPSGKHNQIGPGRAANLAMALEAVAFECVSHISVPDEQIRPALNALAAMFTVTSFGQSQDVGEIENEFEYWRVVRNKSTPFYGLALELGARSAEAGQTAVNLMRDLGVIVGEIVQLHDDMFDALNVPARPDWNRQRNNLLILYAITVDHDDKEEFNSKLPFSHEVDTLERLQKILVTSGAASYCAYQLARRHIRCRQMVTDSALPHPEVIVSLLDDQIRPLRAILESAGAELPADLETYD